VNASFYLFNVDHGQCAAIHLPNGRWCIFDAGCTTGFSPICWLAAAAVSRPKFSTPLAAALAIPATFNIYKATVSHLHCDHLDDYANLFKYSPQFLRTLDPDDSYLTDCESTCADGSWTKVCGFLRHRQQNFGPATLSADYGGVSISELSLPVGVARRVGGDANARVNNASVVTRIDVYGNSILICGDVEKGAWEAIINDTGDYGRVWRPFLANADILVAPHHGHSSGYSVDLLNLVRPSVVLISVMSRDEHVDSRYSGAPVAGIRIGDTDYRYISTRKQGHIRVQIAPPTNALMIGPKGKRIWFFGDEALAIG